MTDITREEMDAKLATVEARAETRFAELSGKLDRILDSMSAATERSIELRADIAGVKSDNKFTRLTIIVAVFASVLAAVAALWTTQGDLLSAFQTGLALHVIPSAPPAGK